MTKIEQLQEHKFAISTQQTRLKIPPSGVVAMENRGGEGNLQFGGGRVLSITGILVQRIRGYSRYQISRGRRYDSAKKQCVRTEVRAAR